MMDIGKSQFTSSASKSVNQLVDFMQSKKHNIANGSHLFVSCFQNCSDGLLKFLDNRGITISDSIAEKLFDKYASKNSHLFFDSGNLPELSDEFKNILINAGTLSAKYEHAYVGNEHIIYSVLDGSPKFCEFLFANDIDSEHLKLSILAFISGESPYVGFDNDNFEDESEDDDDDESLQSKSKTESSIKKYCENLNLKCSLASSPKIRGRDKEISLMEEVLCRKSKSNCILVGEAGTGKTSIVEGLAQLIEDPDYDSPLNGHTIYSLNLGSMLAGTKFRGQLEERMKSLLEELTENPLSILFIDEIHSIIGSGSREGSQDIANLLKPSLARGEIKCIGATTSQEFKKYFEKDSALTRRFHPVTVKEPSIPHVQLMVEKALPSYSAHHSVEFSDSLAQLCVNLCQTYLPSQRFPDKVFDVIDHSLSKARIRCIKNKEDLKVSADDIYNVIADKISVDVNLIKESQKKQFHLFESNMNDQIYGQDKNIAKIYDLLSCARAGLQSPTKPLASFFFVGPTSVGKTFTAKKISQEFYGNNASFLQLNMSEYQEVASISRLIGSSAGYVGYGDGGVLTEFVRKNPNSLVLFDEVEKCNPNILNLLLQILDEGKLNDGLNQSIDFSRSIVVMTSNIGASIENKTQLGFMPEVVDRGVSYTSSVKKLLPPELVSRIDELIVFDLLLEDSLKKIFDANLKIVSSRLTEQSLNVKFDLSASDFIDFKSDDHARDIKKIIRKSIEIPLAKFIMVNPKKKKFSVKMIDKQLIID